MNAITQRKLDVISRMIVVIFNLMYVVHFVHAQDISLAGDYGEPVVIVPAPADLSIAHVAWPKVTRTPDGTLIVAAIAGEFHGPHGGGCPVVSFSTDEGQTFSPLQVLKRYHKKAEYTSGGNCALGIAEDGAVVLLSMAYNGDASNTIDGWRSTDSGRTWTSVDVSTLDRSQTGSVFGNVIHVPGQGLAVFGHYRKPARKHSGDLWMAWSRDQGMSWEKPQSVELETNLRLAEPAVTFAGGRFVGLIRNGKDYYTEITSSDLGVNWNMQAVGLKSDYEGPLSLPSPCIVPDPEHPERLLALVSERHQKNEQGGILGRIVLWEAHAQELNWRKIGEIAQFPEKLKDRKDITYPWMAPMGDNQWFIVFYCGKTRGASDLYGLKVQIP